MGNDPHIGKALAIAVTLMMASMPLFAAVTPSSALYLSDEPSSEGLEYSYGSDGTATVTKWTGNNNILAKKNVSIPSTVSKDGKEYRVTAIGDIAFEGCNNIKSVSIPDSVKTIGESAFYGCGLTGTLTIPDNVETIGDYAFSYCYDITSVSFGSGVKTIGDYAFTINSLTGTLTIPDNVETIGDYAFSYCISFPS